MEVIKELKTKLREICVIKLRIEGRQPSFIRYRDSRPADQAFRQSGVDGEDYG